MPWHDPINPLAPLRKSSITDWTGEEQWKKDAKLIMKNYYLQFQGSQFNEYKLPQQKDHLLFRVLYALYGPPQENATENAVDNSSKDYKDYPADCDVGYHFTYMNCESTEDSFEESSQTESQMEENSSKDDEGEEDNFDLPEEFLASYNDSQKKEALLITEKLIKQSQFEPKKSKTETSADEPNPDQQTDSNPTESKTETSADEPNPDQQTDSNPTESKTETSADEPNPDQDDMNEKTKDSNSKEQPVEPSVAYVGIIFICCKDENKREFCSPIFSVLQKNQNVLSAEARRSFIDRTGRVYGSWKAWMEKNTLPQLKYVIPANGFYTNGEGLQYEYDPSKDLDLLFVNSPACSPKAKVARSLDAASTAGLLGVGVISIAALTTAAIPAIVLTGAGYVGFGCGIYGFARGAHRLYDKKYHDEEMRDLETCVLALSMVAAPLTVGTASANAYLVKLAQAEAKVAGETLQLFVTILNASTLTVDFAFLCFGLTNLVQKAMDGGLTTLDVLQFSMSTFFFMNTVVKPVVAEKIIHQAQNERINNARQAVDNTDAFDNYLKSNRHNNDLDANARIISNLNKIDDPKAVFGSVGNNVRKIKISGKNDQNLLLVNDNKTLKKLNPRTVAREQPSSSKVNVKYTAFYESSKKNGSNEHMNMRNMTAFAKLLTDAAMGNKNIIKISEEIIRIFKIDKTTASIVQVIAFVINECKKKCESSVHEGAQNVADDLPNLTKTINAQLKIAKEIAKKNHLNFHDDFQLFIFYKKYGIDFPFKLQTQEISLHIEHSPEHLKGMLAENSTFKLETDDGIVRSYELTRNGKLTVTMNNFFHGCSIDVKTGAIRSVLEQLKDFINSDDIRELVEGMPFHVFHAQGFTTSNERFYSNVPIRVFLEGDPEGIPFTDLLHK